MKPFIAALALEKKPRHADTPIQTAPGASIRSAAAHHATRTRTAC
jgi:hypothetical protein